MGCCGNKRKEWLKEANAPVMSEQDWQENNYSQEDKPGREFEYTGDSSLEIIGTASRKAYIFRYKGDIQKIDYADTFALMAERDLKLIAARKY